MKHRSAWVPIVLLFAIGSIAGEAQPPYRLAVLPADTVLRVRLDDTIGSDRSRPGDHFTASVEDPSLPTGTLVHGVVIDASPADKQTRGSLGVDFQTLELPDGRRIPIEGSPSGLDSKSVRTTASGGLVARSSHSSGSTGKYIAYGAGGGLLIGSLLGKNVVGGLLGAGAGYLFGKHNTAHRDVVLQEGKELGVRLDQRVVLANS
jgi:hypothetical protein